MKIVCIRSSNTLRETYKNVSILCCLCHQMTYACLRRSIMNWKLHFIGLIHDSWLLQKSAHNCPLGCFLFLLIFREIAFPTYMQWRVIFTLTMVHQPFVYDKVRNMNALLLRVRWYFRHKSINYVSVSRMSLHIITVEF